MEESQNIEYKEIWKDDFLKWIAGFANASGGKLYIGIDDSGKVVGIKNANKLLEDIPNKIVSILGIIPEVYLKDKEDKKYIEITVTPSSVPISYKGSYFIRSGSTMQELKGSALHQFLIRRTGKSWDNLPCEGATIKDIDESAVKYFIQKATASNRVVNNTDGEGIESILENLDLLTEDKKLKNAAVLLYGKKPAKFFPGAYFKIGRFINSDDDLRFQDIVEGNVLEMADKVVGILKTKYLISPISYEGLQRIEKLELPEDALREAIFNAIVHKDYTGAPIQLSVYNDKLILWNEGRLPEGFTIETLLQKHPSRPYNRTIAEIFFKTGFIEAWGRGISKIINGFEKAKLPVPYFEAKMGGVFVTIYRRSKDSEGLSEGLNEGLNEGLSSLLNIIKNKPGIQAKEISKILNRPFKTVERQIGELKKLNYIVHKGSKKTGGYYIQK